MSGNDPDPSSSDPGSSGGDPGPSGGDPGSSGGDPDRTAPVRTWRPRGVILTAALFTVVFVIGCLLGWFGLPPEIRERFTAFQIGTLLAILAVMEIVMWLLAGSSVRADAGGLTVRNGWSRHRLRWDQVHRVRLRPGDPWATAELRDATARSDGDARADREPRTVMLFGLQGSEGAAARTAVRELNAYLAAR